MSEQVTDGAYAVTRPNSYGSGIVETGTWGKWINAPIATPFGYVLAYSQWGGKSVKHTSLRFIVDGICHYREIQKKSYTKRGLVTLAHRFAQEVMEQS